MFARFEVFTAVEIQVAIWTGTLCSTDGEDGGSKVFVSLAHHMTSQP